MPRTFDGVDDTITLSLGALGFAFGPGTIAAIIKRSADATLRVLFLSGVSTAARFGMAINNSNVLTLVMNNAQNGAPAVLIDTCLTADGWLLIAVTKATGAVAPRFHRYEYATATWQHADSLTTIANSGTPITSATIGATNTPASFFAGDVAIVAAWDVVLADAQIEAMAYSLPAWFAVQPKGLWLLDQAATSQKVNDGSGGGANESAITGTTVGASSVPVFSYGAPILKVA